MAKGNEYLAKSFENYFTPEKTSSENTEVKKAIKTALLISGSAVAYANGASSTLDTENYSISKIFSSEEVASSFKLDPPKDAISLAIDNGQNALASSSEAIKNGSKSMKNLVVSILPKPIDITTLPPAPTVKQIEESQSTNPKNFDSSSQNTSPSFGTHVNYSNGQNVINNPKFGVKYSKSSGITIDGKFFGSRIASLYHGNREIVFDARTLPKTNKYYKYIFSPHISAGLPQNCTRYVAARLNYNPNATMGDGGDVATNLILNRKGQVIRGKFEKIGYDELQKLQPGAIISTKAHGAGTFDHVMFVESVDVENQYVLTSGMNEGPIYNKNSYMSPTHAGRVSSQKISFDHLRRMGAIIAMPTPDAQLKGSNKTALETFVQSGQEFGLTYPAENIKVTVSTPKPQSNNTSSEKNSENSSSDSEGNANSVTTNSTSQTTNTDSSTSSPNLVQPTNGSDLQKKIFESQVPNLNFLPQNLALQVEKLGYEPYDIKKDLLSVERVNDDLTGHVFILDSGHGGADSGAVFDGKKEGKTVYLTEASANWREIILMAKYIVARGGVVYFTQIRPIKFDGSNINFFGKDDDLTKLTQLATTPDYHIFYFFSNIKKYIKTSKGLKFSQYLTLKAKKKAEMDERNKITFSIMQENKTSPITFISLHKDAGTYENRFSIEVEKDDPASIKFSDSLAEKINRGGTNPRVHHRGYSDAKGEYSLMVLREPNHSNSGYDMREILIESADIGKDYLSIMSDEQTNKKINIIGDALVGTLQKTTSGQVASIPALPQNTTTNSSPPASTTSQTNTSQDNTQNQNFSTTTISPEQQSYQNIIKNFKSSTQETFYQNIFSDKNFINSQDPNYWLDIQQQILLAKLKEKNLGETESKFLNAYFGNSDISDTDKKVNRLISFLNMQPILGDDYSQFETTMKNSDYGFGENRQDYNKAINQVLIKIGQNAGLDIMDYIKPDPTKNDVYNLILKDLGKNNPNLQSDLKDDFEKLGFSEQNSGSNPIDFFKKITSPKTDFSENTPESANNSTPSTSQPIASPITVSQAKGSTTSISPTDQTGVENVTSQNSSQNTPTQDSQTQNAGLAVDINFDDKFLSLTQNFSDSDKSHLKYFEEVAIKYSPEKKDLFVEIMQEMKEHGVKLSSLDQIQEYIKTKTKFWSRDVKFESSMGTSVVRKDDLLKMMQGLQNY